MFSIALGRRFSSIQALLDAFLACLGSSWGPLGTLLGFKNRAKNRKGSKNHKKISNKSVLDASWPPFAARGLNLAAFWSPWGAPGPCFLLSGVPAGRYSIGVLGMLKTTLFLPLAASETHGHVLHQGWGSTRD